MRNFLRYLTLQNQAPADGGDGGGGPAATPPAAAPAPAAQPPAAPAPTIVTSGNAVVDYAMAEIAALGIAGNHPALELAKAGNFSMLEVELAKTGKPTAASLVSMLKSNHEAEAASRAAAAKQSEEVLVSTFGSAEQKEAALKWVAQNADQDEARAINTMLALGGANAKIAAIAMAALYSQHGSGQAPAPAPMQVLKKEAAAGGNADASPLTRKAFGAESEKLAREVGSQNLQRHPLYQSLVARRKAGMAAGI